MGGIFFDDLNQPDFATCFQFLQNVGAQYINGYIPLLEKRKDTPYTEQHRKFQSYRRGRYVEFNLVYDRGTLFGLQFGGRIESILVSMPPLVHFDYNWQPEANSEEDKLYQHYLKPQDWVAA